MNTVKSNNSRTVTIWNYTAVNCKLQRIRRFISVLVKPQSVSISIHVRWTIIIRGSHVGDMLKSVFWAVTLCGLQADTYVSEENTSPDFGAEDGDSTFLRNANTSPHDAKRNVFTHTNICSKPNACSSNRIVRIGTRYSFYNLLK
jgi:hypothetical protein